MKAVRYKKPYTVAVEDVPEPEIEQPLDAIVRITTTNICGSDLHMYEGRTSVEENKILGHENMGIVEEVGPAVNRVRAGDRVSVPFNIACGTCRNCVDGWTSFCLRTNPTEGMDGGAYGYANMGPYAGHRRRRRVHAAGPGRRQRPGPEGPRRLRLRDVLHQGSAYGDGAVSPVTSGVSRRPGSCSPLDGGLRYLAMVLARGRGLCERIAPLLTGRGGRG